MKRGTALRQTPRRPPNSTAVRAWWVIKTGAPRRTGWVLHSSHCRGNKLCGPVRGPLGFPGELSSLSRPGGADGVGRVELAEVRFEAAGQIGGLGVVGCFVGPGVARVQDLRRYTGATHGDVQSEGRLCNKFNCIQLAIKRGAYQCPGVFDAHAFADAKFAAGPTGVHQPTCGFVVFEAGAKQLRVSPWSQRQERQSKASRKLGDRLRTEAGLGSSQLGRIAGEEVVHCLLGGESRDGGQDAESVGGQEEHVGGMPAYTGDDGIVDAADWISGAGVLIERNIGVI